MAKMLLSNLSSGPLEVPSPRGIRPSPTTMPESSSSSTPPAVKRACDACHRRKVKCIGDGSRPCKNCTSAGLTCTYNAIPQKKGPKGSRAKVISELRENQRQTQLAAAQQHGFDEGHHSPAYLKKAGLLSMEMITSCVDFFFANIYPTQPILHRAKVGETIGQMETSVEAYCLVVSLCAYMMIQPNMQLPPGSFRDLDVQPQPSLELGQRLLAEAIRVRKGYDYVEVPTIWTVITSFFLFGSNFCLDKHNTAWFHLREATTLAQIMGMHDESHYQLDGDIIENSRKRRLYWLLFVTERAYALQQHRPLTLHATISPPRLDEDPSETVELSGFIHLVNLFRPFDDTFVGLWNKAKTGCTTDWLARLQQQLTEALPIYLQSTESQAVDLRCSQQWLRTMVWQLSISHGYLSSVANENAMSFRYPIEISRDLVAATSTFSQQAMEVHGIGLIEKLFDVACTLTDVMSCVPYEQHTFEYGPRDYLNQLMTLISSLRGGQQRYMPLLLSKVNEAMPQMPTHGYSMSMAPPASRLGMEDLYDSASQGHAHSSTASTPFGSPPLSSAAASMVSFPQDNSYPPVSSGVNYSDIPPASAPMPIYQHEPTSALRGYPTSNPMQKFEGQG